MATPEAVTVVSEDSPASADSVVQETQDVQAVVADACSVLFPEGASAHGIYIKQRRFHTSQEVQVYAGNLIDADKEAFLTAMQRIAATLRSM